ncbi:similar to tRNA methyltransferase subunit GCD14 [Plenodomus lingam JN3]|uniref:tRNA (adenine(58)-N(1))-methyltransferase catalytic subunit TRM61 n=1 Tax=Leptosphaeria maculans (strain JN3 / isolate v23.1.3 / race Av1-4-5-6-7-8) TaxID=985895 RepID=E5AC38_LEPMJ|nr:similar to tRNA methyltransferase subunit GCD14 [Plenodomus lingam JN3]CBY00149.1 similar to tRNA methyltransferase subunit GCD14 [Plenodomus lingam JN3]
MAPILSPFLDPGTHATAHSLGILQLRRDHLIPAVLAPDSDSEYAEGKVENTRFGSYPHSTLVDQPWGTQILASIVDTGSRGRSKKRKRGDAQDSDASEARVERPEALRKEIVKAAAASSGFAHLVPPTPETWTLSLPHRTQVVYTPDYSYILQRLRARPGDHVIEAGARSGSFTHAAVRAIYNGYPGTSPPNGDQELAVGIVPSRRKRTRRQGGVYSFEYHEPRAKQLQAEIIDHGLSPFVTVTHRDVYGDGFLLDDASSPDADIIFLDLPAPWQALKHLTRSPPTAETLNAVASETAPPGNTTPAVAPSPSTSSKPFCSPLNPRSATRICTFSPCIEQVTRTVSALRSYGWLSIDMVEVQAKRLEVRRERVGLAEEGVRGGNATAASVDEAVQRLREVEGRAAVFHSLQKEKQEEIMRAAEAKKRGEAVEAVSADGANGAKGGKKGGKKVDAGVAPQSKQERVEQTKKETEGRALFKEGRLVHRTEPELKTHTSYLVFAVLPREWREADEEKAKRKWTTEQKK